MKPENIHIFFKGEEYKQHWTREVSLPEGADFYAAVEMAKKIAAIPGMLKVAFLVDLGAYDLVFENNNDRLHLKRIEKSDEKWMSVKPKFVLILYYPDKNIYPELHEILFNEYKDVFPGLYTNTGA